ncbi:MAG: hypothetical protein ACLFXM_11825 [Acidimicrobiia bacterium]
MRTTRACTIMIAVALAIWIHPTSPAGAAAEAPGDGCQRVGPDGKCIVNERDEGPTEGDGGGWSGPPIECTWVRFENQADGRAYFPELPKGLPGGGPLPGIPELNPGAYVYEDCGPGGGNGRHDPWERVGWAGTSPGVIGPAFALAPTSPPTAGEVADDLWAGIEATLPAPRVVTSPPAGVAAIVEQPTFVAVENWTEVNETDCDDVSGVVCVSLVATPHLVFDPGDGSDPILCQGAGTVYDPAGPLPSVQAEAPGACAHTYLRRTGVNGRPASWPGTVTVTWEVSWSSTTPVASGTFPDFSLSADLEREVDEVQGIVVSSGRGLDR